MKVAVQDSLSIKQLDEVVVRGQYEPQSAQQSVYKVRTISQEQLKEKGTTRIQDVLNTELNIRFSQDLSLGGSTISLQGLAGQNVKVLIDGVPMVGRQGTSNEININQINVNSIERIEIVECPMSVMYGADALAGVINTAANPTTLIPYVFLDVVLQNRNQVQATQILNSVVSYENFTEANLSRLVFNPSQIAIGSSWRSGGGPSGGPSLRTDRFYVVKDAKGNFYKLKFTALTQNGERGRPQIVYALVKKGV